MNLKFLIGLFWNIIKNFYYYKRKIIQFMFDIQLSQYPMFIQYKPADFLVKGKQTLEIMQLLKAGDIIGRNFKSYLSNKFIPGDYTFSGVYIGNNKVIHAIREGVSETNIVDYLRCDGVCILRPKKGVTKALKRLESFVGREYDYDFNEKNGKFYSHELVHEAYSELEIQREFPQFFGKRLRFMDKIIVFNSFVNSKDFKKIYEFYPERGDAIEQGIENILTISKSLKKKREKKIG